MTLQNKDVFIISTYPPTPGGISNFTKRTVDSLRKIGIKVNITPYLGVTSVFKIAISLLRTKPTNVRMEYDISTYGASGPFLIFLVWFLRIILGYRLFFNFHEVTRDLEHLKLVGRLYYIFIARFTEFITVHTQESKRTLINKCFVNKSKIVVIPLGTMTKDQATVPFKQTQQRYVLEKDYFLFIGFIHPQKGIENFIKAGKYLEEIDKEAFINLSFVVAGGVRPRKGVFKIFQKADNDYFDSLKTLVTRLKMENKVKFLGYIEDRYFSSLIINSKGVVVPYIKTEQSGVLNQVLPYQVPIIASNTGGLGETLEDYGLLVEKNDFKQIAEYMRKLYRFSDFRGQLLKGYEELNKELDPLVVAQMFAKGLK